MDGFHQLLILALMRSLNANLYNKDWTLCTYYAGQKAWLLAAFYPGVTLFGRHSTLHYIIFFHFYIIYCNLEWSWSLYPFFFTIHMKLCIRVLLISVMYMCFLNNKNKWSWIFNTCPILLSTICNIFQLLHQIVPSVCQQ